MSFVVVERELGTLPLAVGIVGSFGLEKLFGVSGVDNYGSLVTLSFDSLKNSNAVSFWSLLKEKGPPCLWLQNVYGSINSS